jgi:hypothetical protein
MSHASLRARLKRLNRQLSGVLGGGGGGAAGASCCGGAVPIGERGWESAGGEGEARAAVTQSCRSLEQYLDFVSRSSKERRTIKVDVRPDVTPDMARALLADVAHFCGYEAVGPLPAPCRGFLHARKVPRAPGHGERGERDPCGERGPSPPRREVGARASGAASRVSGAASRVRSPRRREVAARASGAAGASGGAHAIGGAQASGAASRVRSPRRREVAARASGLAPRGETERHRRVSRQICHCRHCRHQEQDARKPTERPATKPIDRSPSRQPSR